MRPGGSGRGSRPAGTALAGALVVVALLTVLVAGAPPAAAETALGVDPGYAGAYAPGWPVPVRVQVTADRLLRGRVEVTLDGAAPVAVPVEVPGGSQKQFLVVVPSSPSPRPLEVTARLLEDSKALASARVSARAAVDQELVGLLPGALAGRGVPGPATLTVDAGTARFVAVGEAELEQAPYSLGPMGTLAMAPGELERMSPAARRGVLAWLEGGGHLLVDGEPGAAVAGLPDAWQPGDRSRVAAGVGEVRLTGEAIAAGQWSQLVEPTGRGVSRSSRNEFGIESSVGRSLATTAGLRVPAVRWLVAFLAVYVIVVGPVLFVVVRRRGKPEVAWVAVPLVALLFTTGSYVAGRGVRGATSLVHASILTTGPTGTTARTFLGVFSRSGETVRVGAPRGWITASGSEANGSILSQLESVTLTGDGPQARLPLDAGQFGVLTTTGPVDSPGALEVTATSGADGQASGRVRNATPYPLSDTVVFVGTSGTAVGGLEPGEERDWSVAGAGDLMGPPPEFRLWRNVSTGDRGGDLSLWEAAKSSAGPDFRGPGAVVAAGWTEEFDPPVRLGNGSAHPAGRTLVVGRAPVHPSGSAVTDMAVRREIVRDAESSGSATTARFVLPGDIGGRPLLVRSPVAGFEVWKDGAWSRQGGNDCVQLPGAPPGVVDCGGRGGPFRAEVALPAGSATDGIVYVRLPSIPAMALDGRAQAFTLRVGAA